ncbi:MAG: TIGR02266 family protein [Myxococcota bacterium]
MDEEKRKDDHHAPDLTRPERSAVKTGGLDLEGEPSAVEPGGLDLEREPSAVEPGRLDLEREPSAVEPGRLDLEREPSAVKAELEQEPSTRERRRAVRAPIELKVEYKRLNSFFADYTRNISQGGTFIKTHKPLDIGTEFVFRMTVPKLKEPLVLHGKVQWVVSPAQAGDDQDPGMGIGFIYDSEADRARIGANVERLMIESLGEVLYRKLKKHMQGA